MLTLAPTVNAQVPVSSQTFGQCIGESLADYMNALIAAKGSGQIPSNVKLLSPALNMTSSTLPGIVDGMRSGGANFGALDGIAGNVYNVGGQPISYYMDNVRRLFPGANFIITETGTFDQSQYAVTDLAEELRKLRDSGDVRGMLLFNALRTNSQFNHHGIDPEDIKNILCEGDCSNKNIGINTGRFFANVPDSYYSTAGNGNINGSWSLEIADSGQIQNAIKGIQNSIDNGMTPIIRIGVGSDSGGFDDPGTYAAFLSQVASQFPGVDIYAIAGPNEPDLENWLNPACYAMIIQTAMACGGPLDYEPVSYRGEIIGLSNGGPPWQLSAALSDTSGDEALGIDGIADRLTANLIIQTTANYNHPLFEAITDNIVGEPGSINTLIENDDEPFHVKTRLKDKPYLGSFEVPTQAPKDQTGFGDETYEDWTKRLFTTTSEDGGIRFGTKATMPTTNFIGCLQRPACDPNSEETCLKVSNGNELCEPGDDPATCVSVGRLFTFVGEINHEEPSDLQAIVRSRQNAKSILLTPPPGERTQRTENRFSDNVTYQAMAVDNALAGYGLEVPPMNVADISKDQIARSQASGSKTNTATPITNIIKPTPVSAQDESGWVRGSLSLFATQNDGGSYNVTYRYTVTHASPCGLGDISSKINGQEINIWARTSGPGGEAYLEPGFGGAPMFVDVSLPFTVTVDTHGRWVGPEYCRSYERFTTSCTITGENADGTLASTCGTIPEPPPLDCRNCPAWAPSSLCQPIVAPTVAQENRCANGLCETGENTTIEDVDYPDDDFKIDFNFSWLPAWITNLIGFYSISCESVHDTIGGIPYFQRYQCLFNNKDYLLYAYAPSGFLGDLQQYRTQDLEIHNALYRIKGRTDQYFDNFISSKHQVAFNLGFKDVAARKGGEIEGDIGYTPISPDYADPGNEKFVHLGLKGSTVRTMNVEFYELFQPQLSGYCLGVAFENFRGEFDESLLENCDRYEFVPQGLSSGNRTDDLPPAQPTSPPPVYTGGIQAALQEAANKNGIPFELLRTILEIEAGPGYTTGSQCTRNSWTATGPFQIIDSTADSLTSPEERSSWNIRGWAEGQDHSTDGRCRIDIASELAARLLRRNVGGTDIDSTNVDQVKRAARGYYGSCQPDQYTDAAFGLNISYCDYVIYRMNLCSELSPTCDGESGSQTAAVQPKMIGNFASAAQADKVLESNLISNMTEKDKMQFRMALLKDIEDLVEENKEEIEKNNGEIPANVKNAILASVSEITLRFRSKYNL